MTASSDVTYIQKFQDSLKSIWAFWKSHQSPSPSPLISSIHCFVRALNSCSSVKHSISCINRWQSKQLTFEENFVFRLWKHKKHAHYVGKHNLIHKSDYCRLAEKWFGHNSFLRLQMHCWTKQLAFTRCYCQSCMKSSLHLTKLASCTCKYPIGFGKERSGELNTNTQYNSHFTSQNTQFLAAYFEWIPS